MQNPPLFPYTQRIKFCACISLWPFCWNTNLFKTSRRTLEATQRHHQQQLLPNFQGLCIKLDDDPLPIFFPRLQYLLPITLNQGSSLFSLFTKECFLLSCRTNSSLHTPVSIFTFLCFSAFSGSGRKRSPLSGMSISTNMHYAHCSWLAAAEGYFSSQVHQVVLQTLIWLLHLHRQMLDDCIQVKPRRR